MILGSNAAGTGTTTFDLAPNYIERINREWRAEVTGTASLIHMKIDSSLITDTSWDLLVDADGNFTSGATKVGDFDVNGETSFTPVDEMFYAVARASTDAPG
jgi:hypothetical protein